MDAKQPTLIFVYNADSGLFNTLADIAHKIFSPQTYACRLCALTHTPVGMRQEWKEFIQSLPLPVEFLHRDELAEQYGFTGIALPALFLKREDRVELWIDAKEINATPTLDALKRLISERIAAIGVGA